MTAEQGYLLIGLVAGFAGGISLPIWLDLWKHCRELDRADRAGRERHK